MRKHRTLIGVFRPTSLNLHVLASFPSFSTTMEYIEDKSSPVGSAVGYFAFNFSIAALTSFLLWYCLERWYFPQAKQPLTPLVLEGLVL